MPGMQYYTDSGLLTSPDPMDLAFPGRRCMLVPNGRGRVDISVEEQAAAAKKRGWITFALIVAVAEQ